MRKNVNDVIILDSKRLKKFEKQMSDFIAFVQYLFCHCCQAIHFLDSIRPTNKCYGQFEKMV